MNQITDSLRNIQLGLDAIEKKQKDVKALARYASMGGGQAMAICTTYSAKHSNDLKMMASQIKAFMRGDSIAEVATKFKTSFKTNAYVAVLVTSMRIYQDYKLYSQMVFTGVELAKKIVRHSVTAVVTSAATYGGMLGGAQVGTMIIPGVGTVIGGLLGGLFAGLIVENVTTKACKYIMNEKEYQLDVIQADYTEDMQQLLQSYLQALTRRCLYEYSTDNEVKAQKKKDLITLSPDKNPHIDKEEGTFKYASAIADYEIIKGYRKLENNM